MYVCIHTSHETNNAICVIFIADQIIANSHSDVGADCPPVEYRPNGANCDKTCAELPYEHADVWCIEVICF